jgi:hypothetical protein
MRSMQACPATDALPAPELARFTPDALAFAASAWPMRAAEELRSALVYRALATASVAVLPAFALRFAAVAREEVGHARLCATLAAQLGAAPPRYDANPVRARLAGLTEPRERVVALVITEVAIGETVSMAMFRESWRRTTEPLSRIAVERILADESRHQQLGWEALAALGACAVMQRRASEALAATEQQIAVPALRFLDAGRPFDPAWAALGVIPPAHRVEAFYAAVEQIVIPHLSRVGIDGRRAWDERYRTSDLGPRTSA